MQTLDARAWLAEVTKETARRTLRLKPFMKTYFEHLLAQDGDRWRTSVWLISAVQKQMDLVPEQFNGTLIEPEETPFDD